VLAAGTAAQASFAAFGIGLPVLAPTLRDEYGLSLTQIGIVLSAEWVGALLTLLAWGLAADRAGERPVLAFGLVGCAAALAGAAFAPDFTVLVLLLGAAGGSGAGVIAASGRAVVHWFAPEERGLALGVRQTAIPIGGLVSALTVPALAAAGGSRAALLFIAALCLAGAVVGAAVIRGREGGEPPEPAPLTRTLRDARLWRLCAASGLYLYAQVAVIGFGVLFLHDERGFSDGSAALVIGGAQVLAGALRIGVGRWSDVVGSRVLPLRRVGAATCAMLAMAAAAADASGWLLVPLLVVVGGLSMAWNGLSFAAAAELAGPARSGAAIGLQQSALSAAGIVAPLAFAATVAAASWPAAFGVAALFPLLGMWTLRSLARH
jgi:sugar phosphate permease